MNNYKSFTIGMLVVPLALLALGIAVASSVVTPNTFVAGTAAVASQVNANFTAHAAAINDNDTRIAALAAGLPDSSLVRASYVEDSADLNDYNETSGTPGATIITSSVNAPVAGILMIWGSWNAEFDASSTGDGTNATTQFLVDGTGQGAIYDHEVKIDDGATTGFGAGFQNLFRAVPVTAGAHTVAMEVAQTSATSMIFITHRSLMTLFVPFGNAGTQGSL